MVFPLCVTAWNINLGLIYSLLWQLYMNWLSLHCFIWRCFRGTASLCCTTTTGSQVNLGIFSCLLEERLDLWLVALPLRQSATWWCCSLVHLRLAPIKTELLTCTELHDFCGSHWYPCFSQMLVWIIVSSLPFSLIISVIGKRCKIMLFCCVLVQCSQCKRVLDWCNCACDDLCRLLQSEQWNLSPTEKGMLQL